MIRCGGHGGDGPRPGTAVRERSHGWRSGTVHGAASPRSRVRRRWCSPPARARAARAAPARASRYRHLGRRRAEGLHGDGRALGDPDRYQGQVHGHPRPQHGADDRCRLGRPARPRRPAGPGPDGRVRQGAARSSRSTTCSTSPTYKAETAPALVELGTVDGKVVRRLHQGRRQGPDLVQPQAPRLRVGPAEDVGRPASAGHGQQGRRQGDWCVGIESGAASGWPGTDWIEDIVLRQAGPDSYNQW